MWKKDARFGYGILCSTRVWERGIEGKIKAVPICPWKMKFPFGVYVWKQMAV